MIYTSKINISIRAGFQKVNRYFKGLQGHFFYGKINLK